MLDLRKLPMIGREILILHFVTQGIISGELRCMSLPPPPSPSPPPSLRSPPSPSPPPSLPISPSLSPLPSLPISSSLSPLPPPHLPLPLSAPLPPHLPRPPSPSPPPSLRSPPSPSPPPSLRSPLPISPSLSPLPSLPPPPSSSRSSQAFVILVVSQCILMIAVLWTSLMNTEDDGHTQPASLSWPEALWISSIENIYGSQGTGKTKNGTFALGGLNVSQIVTSSMKIEMDPPPPLFM